MKINQLESREEIMKIINERRAYERAHEQTEMRMPVPKFKLDKFIENHPLVFMYSLVPIIGSIVSFITG